jgi:RNA polymerase sigma-70 factor (ECF subfamily)
MVFDARKAPPQGLDEADQQDLALMRQVQADDHEAFTRLAERTGPRVEGLLRRTLPAAEVDWARNTVLFRAWERRRQYDERRGPVRYWLTGIARNVVRDVFRGRRRGPARVSLGVTTVAETVADRRQADPAAAAERADWAAAVRRRCDEVLAEFPQYVRDAWNMRLEDTAYQDIARTLGRPVGTVAGAVFRVRARVLARVRSQLAFFG